ncbi:MAG TPA: hypothetical protein VFV50_03895 [Bdellovibrionales bacterium]|nr:hypothetical protein [Bdellovibrionales bacterium]
MKTREWTKTDIASQFANCSDLTSLIRQVEKRCADDDEVVCEIRVNGVVLDEQDEAKFGSTELARIDQLAIKVSAVQNLVNEAVNALNDYIPEMIRISVLTAERFRNNEMEPACRSLDAITQGSRWLVDMFAQLRRNKVISRRQIDENDWTRSEGEFLRVTRDLVTAFEAQDYVLLADVLEYDWVTALQGWLDLLRSGDMEVSHGNSRKPAPNSVDGQ